MSEPPFYERTLDSFSDEIITKVRQADNGLWYASLDAGADSWSRHIHFDFASCSDTREGAIRQCATKMRNDAKGIGKYAPHSCWSGYDFKFILCKRWAEKETAVEARP